LGDHIDQKGSLVAPTKLRFDFSHKAQVTIAELAKIESISNDWIKRNVKVFSAELDLKTAQKIPGLRAVFGEAYPDPVKVVTLEFSVEEISQDISNPRWRKTSVEFCGGTCVSFISRAGGVHRLTRCSTLFAAMLQRRAISRTL
jgi:alanyl-tRNA synthetase